MPSNAELYTYYCRRSSCHPNSRIAASLKEAGEAPLHALDVSANYLGQRGLIPVLDLVKNTKTIHTLNISNTAMSMELVRHLAYCLALHPCIKTLVMRNTQLDDTHADPLLQLLSLNTSIAVLEVEGNHFTPGVLHKLDAALRHNSTVRLQQQAEDAAHQSYVKERAVARRTFTTTISGAIAAAESGGYVHFPTWWRNPQYTVATSRSSRVVFVLDCTLADARANQMGLMVLRHDGIHRAVEMAATTIVAESTVSDRQCSVEAALEAGERYVVMPYTFNPGRALPFTLSASLVDTSSDRRRGAAAGGAAQAEEEGWITLEAVDPRHDWSTHTVEGDWTAENSGGSGGNTTWRRNDMYRVTRAAASVTEGASKAAGDGDDVVTMYVLLTRDAPLGDAEACAIGVDVVRHDPHNSEGPPLFWSPEVVCASSPRSSAAASVAPSSVLVKLELPLRDLDVYVVPSTETPGQTGSYSLTVFSAVDVDVTHSAFPHGWRHRRLSGRWDETCCGGCRAASPSWKNNPSFAVTVEDASRPLIACVELRAPQEGADTCADTQQAEAEACAADAEGDETVAAPLGDVEAAMEQRRAELDEFRQRHRTSVLEVGVMALKDEAPAYMALATSAQMERAAVVVVTPTAAAGATRMLIVPMLRHAADVGHFTLELFSPAPFVVASDGRAECLAMRERQAQLAAYHTQDEERAEQRLAAVQDAAGGGTTDTPLLREVRETIRAAVATTGLRFADRDFPRGASSLFLDPAGPPPLDFPRHVSWCRVSEMNRSEGSGDGGAEAVVSAAAMAPPHPYSRRHWFASVLHAIAAKPGWLARIFVTYDSAAGFAQFRFHKQDRWVGVTVDDFLLVDNQNDLVCGRSSQAGDFFFPLAEKAYAKLHRCYAALEPAVCPDQTLSDLLVQGLMDVSGGVASAAPLRQSGDREVSAEEGEALWRLLKRSVHPSLLCAVMLQGSSPGSRERAHVGVLADRLYGVVDVRFVELQRLVKLRLYDGTHDADAVWRGRWRFDSPLWTPTLRAALHYEKDDEPHVAWLHLDELLYYFSHVFTAEIPSSVVRLPGSFAESTENDPPSSDVTLRNPQFALDVTAGSAGLPATAELEVRVGLHRRDPRLDITRARGATARLRPALGFAVFATHDNKRRLTHIAGDGSDGDRLLQLVAPTVQRDAYATLRLSAELLASRHLTVMPFRENLRDPDVAYTLSASCTANATLELRHVTPNTRTAIAGSWGGVRAGPPEFPQWRNNPQYFLSAATETEVTLTLRPAGATTAATLGFTLHRTQRCCSFLSYDEDTVVARASSGASGAAASCVVRLAGMSERRGMPYVVVPSSTEDAGDFVLEVVANDAVQLRPIDARLDWHRAKRTVSICAANGNTGGSPAFPSWRFNTQLAITLPVEREGRLFIAARRLRSADPRVKIGMLLLRSDAALADAYRRRLTYAPGDVVATSTESTTETVVDAAVSLPRDRGALILVVYADRPYKEAEVELSFYAGPLVDISPVQEWPCVSVQDGSWNLGTTAAGSRVNFASWINNPFYGLTVLRPTRVTLLLVQYPRDHEHPAVKRHGEVKAWLPPPLTHPDRCTSIELSVVKYDATLTQVAATEGAPTACAETHLTLELLPEQPYLVVPCTTEPQQDGDYKLFAFADHPIDVFVAEKPRLPYV